MTFPGLSGKVCVVTGSAHGIGKEVADTLHRNGSVVVRCDIDKSIVNEPDGRRLDVGDPTAVEAVVSQVESDVGPIDILINTAGVLHSSPLVDTTDADWAHMLSVNTTGVFQLTRSVARRMLPRRRGSVVTVASNAATVPRNNIGGYAASKAASTHLTRCFGLELAPHGIRCNVVAPGSTNTPMLHRLWGDDAQARESTIAGDRAAFRVGIPLGKLAQPTDVASAVCFLASDLAAHITMQELYVDGGASLRLSTPTMILESSCTLWTNTGMARASSSAPADDRC